MQRTRTANSSSSTIAAWILLGQVRRTRASHPVARRGSKEYWYPLTYNSFHYGLPFGKGPAHKNPNMPSWEELIRQRDAVLKKHPKAIIIGAHMGSMTFELQKLAETLDRYPNFHIDTPAHPGPAQSEGGPRFLREVSRSHPVRTDSSVREVTDGIKKWQTRRPFLQPAPGILRDDHIHLVELRYAKIGCAWRASSFLRRCWRNFTTAMRASDPALRPK